MPSIIVLAAGASRRLGRPKQLLMFEGEPLVVRAARIAASVADTVVVIPPVDEIREALRGYRIVENPGRDEGVASSIRAGVSATTGDVLLAVCDQPMITAEHLQSLIRVRSPIAATGYNGISGVPAFFGGKFRGELLALRGDVGARKVIEAHSDELVTIPFAAAAMDVDTEGDVLGFPVYPERSEGS